MTRPLRLEFPGALYHLTARGDRQEDIFSDDLDRRTFLDLLAKEVRQQGWRCYAYCLMSNHYHLLIETPTGNLVAGMRRLNGVYTQAFNRRHQRVGHVMQGRYKSILVEKDTYLLELARYIVLNPVRAKMVGDPANWQWSSYRATLGKVPCPDWLDVRWLLEQFGDAPEVARDAYRRFVRAGVNALSPWENLRGQIWLGSDKFLKHMAKRVQDHPVQGVAATQRQPHRPRANEILQQVAKVYCLPVEQVSGRDHQAAFQAWVYLLRRAANLSLKEVSLLAKISPARISQIQGRIEKQRLDAVLARLLST